MLLQFQGSSATFQRVHPQVGLFCGMDGSYTLFDAKGLNPGMGSSNIIKAYNHTANQRQKDDLIITKSIDERCYPAKITAY